MLKITRNLINSVLIRFLPIKIFSPQYEHLFVKDNFLIFRGAPQFAHFPEFRLIVYFEFFILSIVNNLCMIIQRVVSETVDICQTKRYPIAFDGLISVLFIKVAIQNPHLDHSDIVLAQIAIARKH